MELQGEPEALLEGLEAPRQAGLPRVVLVLWAVAVVVRRRVERPASVQRQVLAAALPRAPQAALVEQGDAGGPAPRVAREVQGSIATRCW